MKFRNKITLHLLNWVTAIILFAENALSQSAYNLEVIARTGGTTLAGNTITALGTGPSINDAGKVAYSVTIQDGRQGIFVSGESSARSSLIENFNVDPFATMSGLSSNFLFPNEVLINNQNRVAWSVASCDGLFAFIFRLGTTSGDSRIVAKSYYDNVSPPDVDLPSPFVGPFPAADSGLKSWVTLDNDGRMVFSGILAPRATTTVLSTPWKPGHKRTQFVQRLLFFGPKVTSRG